MKIFKSALVLTLIGIACGLLIGLTNLVTEPVIKNNELKAAKKAYEGFFPDLDDLEIVEVDGTYVYEYVKLLKDEKVIGHAFRAKGTNQRGLIDLVVGADLEGKILGVKILSTENTPGYYDKYEGTDDEKYLVGIKGDTLGSLDGIDNISKVTQTGDTLNAILKEISQVSDRYVESAAQELTLHEKIFGEGATYEKVETFVGTEEVTNKDLIKDEDGNVIGYAYTGTVTTDIDVIGKKKLSLLVGIDSEGKFVGVQVVLNEHTRGYYERYIDQLNNLKGSGLEDLNVDGQAGSTGTATGINDIFNAIKEVIASE